LCFSTIIVDISDFYTACSLYDYADEQGLLTTKNWSKYTAIEPIMKLKTLTTK